MSMLHGIAGAALTAAASLGVFMATAQTSAEFMNDTAKVGRQLECAAVIADLQAGVLLEGGRSPDIERFLDGYRCPWQRLEGGADVNVQS